MKLREEEFYNQYHQHGGTTIIPTEIFNELYDDATEEIERLNNIINELELTLKDLIFGSNNLNHRLTAQIIFMRLKELERSEKE